MASTKPLPTRLKLLRGTAQPCRINKNEPQPKADKVKPPKYLCEVALAHWHVVIAELNETGIMSNLDVDALAMYCKAYATWLEAEEMLEKEGMTAPTQRGIAVSPYHRVSVAAQNTMIKLAGEFGMTPSSRTKVSTTKKKENDFQDF